MRRIIVSVSDLERSLADGFSTAGTAGTGLGAVRRLAQDFDVHSSVPDGTVIVARLREGEEPADAHAVCVGAVSLAAPGERVCGDGWSFALDGANAALIVADGLGHGPEAAEAAEAALAAFAVDPFGDLRVQLQRLHAALRGTRGAAVMTLRADTQAAVIRSAGAGNVMGRLVSGVSDRTILCQHGTAGVTIRTPDETTTPWPPHALLVACSDEHSVALWDLAAGKVTSRVDVGEDPEAFDLSPDGRTLYVSNEEDSALTAYDIATRRKLFEVKIGAEPEGVKATPDGKLVYVTSEVANMVHVVDVPGRKLARSIAVGKRPRRLLLVGNDLWVTNELDASVDAACAALRGTGATLLNQSVLLRGVNDDADALADLSERLFAAGVLPYYLHQLDRVHGTAHFEVADDTALALLDALRARLPGYLVPRLVREVAGDPAKRPL